MEERDDHEMQEAEPTPHNSSPTNSVEAKLHALLEQNEVDFAAVTSLISEIENNSPNDMQRIFMVYERFLSEFPLCYGYWKKYARHKAYFCTLNEVEQVFERAVQAAAYSVDLWASYCSFGMLAYEDAADVRRLFERGLSIVGKDYLCYLLWDKYIEFEYSQKQWSHLAHIYINALKFPTKKLNKYYESFKKFVTILEEEMGCDNNTIMPLELVSSCEMSNVKTYELSEISDVIRELFDRQGDLPKHNIVKKYLTIGEVLYYKSSLLDRKIRRYEDRIRRPYFHVKPLDDSQLENWHQYLNFIEIQGDFDSIVKLYERCLIPCANYSEFWIRYIEFVSAKGGKEIANHALERALTVFCKRVPAFRLYCSMLKEKMGDTIGARALLLRRGIDPAPEFIDNVNKEANMEKRMGNIEAACLVYEKAIEMAKGKQNSEILAILYANFARFKFVVTGSIDTAQEVFVKGIQQMPCKSIIQGLINFSIMLGVGGPMRKLDSIVASVIAPGSDVSQALSSRDREDISRLFLELVDLHGTIHEIRKAWDRHKILFPHIMQPDITCDYTTTGYNPLVKSVEKGKQITIPPSHHASEENGHNISSVHLEDSQILKNESESLSEEIVMHKLHEDGDKSDTKGKEELVEVVEKQLIPDAPKPDGEAEIVEKQPIPEAPEPNGEAEIVEKQSIPEATKLNVESADLVAEFHGVAQIPEVMPEYNISKNCPHRGSTGDLRPPELANLSISSPINETQQLNQTVSLDRNVIQEATFRAGENEPQEQGDSGEVSETQVSSSIHINSATPSRENLQKENSPLRLVCDSPPPESNANPQIQMQAQAPENLQQALPVNVSCPQNAGTAGNWAQMCYVQSSQPQQWQNNSQMQYSSTGTPNQQMVLTQGYPYQSQAWTSTQDQQAIQAGGQYQMAASQVYPVGSLTWPGQSAQQQAYAYVQPQSSNQPTAQPQTQFYQQPIQSNEQQYGYVQSGQGIPPDIWQYYQQQWYYLHQQQQQNQQVQNNLQHAENIEQLQVNLQQHHQHQASQQEQQQQHNQQQPTHQEQLQRQNQQKPSPQDQQQQQQQLHSPQQNQQSVQFQQQNQQIHNTQLHQHLLYLQQQQQQQQQQLYLQQQQQLYLQQQQLFHEPQFQQLPQQQQQLIFQQQQQLLLQQHQQQLFQLQQQQQQQEQQALHHQQQQEQQPLQQQQQHEQQPLQQQQQHEQKACQQQQSNALEMKTLSSNYYVQQTLSAQQSSSKPNGQDDGEQAIMSQGEGAKLHDAEKSVPS